MPTIEAKQFYAEVDKGEWFTVNDAMEKINPSQAALIDELIEKLRT